jgi:colicin import membrane protein
VSRIPVASELLHRDRIWPAVMASVAVHAAAILLAVKATSLPTIELEQTPIRARLVRLGEKKPEHYLPQKEQPPPPPEPAPAAPAPPVPAPAPPPPEAKPAPVAPVTTAPAAPRAPPPRSAPAKNPDNGGGTSALAALAKVTKEVQRERWGDPNGDPEGDSDEGTEGERYQALLQRALHDNFTLPATIPEKERLYLQALVTIWIEADGVISRFEITKPSGNPVFDAALERAIRATRAPPPPDADRLRYKTRGAPLLFKSA